MEVILDLTLAGSYLQLKNRPNETADRNKIACHTKHKCKTK